MLINGIDGITNTSSNSLKIKVTCTIDHTWTLERDASGTGASYTSEGTLTDAALTSGAYAGVLVQQSTSGFFNKHFFDNFQINPIDITPPTLTAVQVLSANSLELTFSEILNQTFARDTANYTVTPSIGNPATATFASGANFPQVNKVILTFATDFLSTQPYEVIVSGVADANNNAITIPEKKTYTYIAPFVPPFRDIVINEIFADPSPAVDLPESEFVELHNTTDQNINLAGYTFTDGSSTATFGNINLPANAYLIICNTANVALLTPFGTVVGLSSFPSLNNSEETLTLKNPSGKVIDKITYALAWYQDAVKDDGGWTLEQINPKAVCNNAQNWIASGDESGGTPGKQNSVYDLAPDDTAPTLLSIQITGSAELQLHFSETMDSLLLKNIQAYTIDKGLSVISAKALLPDYSAVQLTLNQSPEPGQVYSLTPAGLTDCPGNQIKITSIPFGTGAVPQPYELLITEIMADETPKVDLPEAEFIEIYNTSGKLLSLNDLTFSDGNGSVKLNGGVISAGEYVILCTSGAVPFYKPYGRTISVSGFSLNNSGEPLALTNTQGKLVHAVNYSSAWYRHTEKSNGGWSLEMINPTNTCATAANWIASEDKTGGTPGRQNSVYNLSPDIIAPTLLSVQLSANAELQLNFSKTMDSLLLKNIQAYTIDKGLTVTAAVAVSPEYTTVQLTLNQAPEPGYVYTILVSGLSDCPGNAIKPSTMTFGVGAVPQPYELLITEIMADETPKIGLPEAEFIELFNPTSKLLSLANLTFSDGNGAVKLSGGSIAPHEYIILCASGAVAQYKSYGQAISVSGFFLNNSGEPLTLTNAKGILVHKVHYSSDWYKNTQKSAGGWSLEMVNPSATCRDKSNWTASTDESGGTPGRQNSVFSLAPDLTAPVLQSVQIIGNAELQLTFSKTMDSLLLKHTHFYSIDQGISVTGVTLVSPDYASVRLSLSKPVESGKVYVLTINGLQDCPGNKLTNTTIPFGVGATPQPYELLITEIMADETPKIGLPEAEFIEVFNPTNKLLSLEKLIFSDGNGSVKLNGGVLAAGEYIILCASGAIPLYNVYGRAMSVSGFSLNNSGEALKLTNAEGKVIHAVNYSTEWYRDPVKANGGWSLEMIDIHNPCGDELNWAAAESVNGGTPGKANSVQASKPDLTAPRLLQVLVTDSLHINLLFDEKLDSTAAAIAGIYSLSNNSVEAAIPVSPFFREVQLKLTAPLLKKVLYSLTIKHIRDCNGNISNNLSSEPFTLPEQGDSLDIVINEVLFNPYTGGADFVEIYNRSQKYINLQNWQLANWENDSVSNLKPVSAADYIMAPHSYLVLTTNKANILENYPRSVAQNFLVMKSMPTYTDESGTVILLNNHNKIADRFDYSEDMHFSLIDEVEGVSLERINPDAASNNPSNWHSAASAEGYATPGYRNSQFLATSQLASAFSIFPKVFTPDEDGRDDFTTFNYKFNTHGNVATISIFDVQGREVKKIVDNQLLAAEGFYSWDGTNNQGIKVRTGAYIIYFSLFDMTGKRQVFKERVVVGAKF